MRAKSTAKVDKIMMLLKFHYFEKFPVAKARRFKVRKREIFQDIKFF
jgi:hypothetical protein